MAFFSESDPAAGVFVGLFTGPTNTDADYAEYVEIIRSAVRNGHARCVAVLVVDVGNPPPNAAWRQRIADVSSNVPADAAFAMVSNSTLIRGVATALAWLRPVKYKLGIYSTSDEAVRFAEAHRGEALPALERMLRFVRARAAAAPPVSLRRGRM